MAHSLRRRLRNLGLASSTAALALALVPTPATAYSVSESGLVGEYSYSEGQDTPFATCGYAGPTWRDTNWIWFNWMRVTAPTVTAADRNSQTRDRRTVSFQLKIQRNTLFSSDPWKVVKSSAIQKAPAWDDEPAALSQIKLYFTPKKTISNGQNAVFRAMVVIKWIKRDGTVEGSAKLWPTYYRENSPYHSKPYPLQGDGFCSAIDTDG